MSLNSFHIEPSKISANSLRDFQEQAYLLSSTQVV